MRLSKRKCLISAVLVGAIACSVTVATAQGIFRDRRFGGHFSPSVAIFSLPKDTELRIKARWTQAARIQYLAIVNGKHKTDYFRESKHRKKVTKNGEKVPKDKNWHTVAERKPSPKNRHFTLFVYSKYPGKEFSLNKVRKVDAYDDDGWSWTVYESADDSAHTAGFDYDDLYIKVGRRKVD